MIGIELEPAVICLLASLVWAPVVYVVAGRLDIGRPLSASEMLWLSALAIAALPTLVAPAMAAAGLSLHPAPVAPPLMAPTAPVMLPADFVYETAPEMVSAAPLTAATLIDAAAVIYLYGVLLFFGQHMIRSLVFAARVRAAKAVEYPELARALDVWRRRLDVGAPLRMKKTDAVTSVCVYGVFRPVILIPAELDARLSLDDLVMMGAHELAHMKRRDPLLFAALAAARVLFWFNPFVKRIAARAELAAEQSADALVLERGADRRAYAACFVEGLRFAAERGRRALVAAPSFTPFDRKSRRMRLDAILSGTMQSPRAPSRAVAILAVFAAGVLAFGQAALAVQPAPRAVASKLTTMPVDGEITLDFGKTFIDREGRSRKAHEGVDIRAAEGATVVAPGDGVVIDATDVYQGQPAWGKVVVVDHGDGLVTRYAHLSAYHVKKGDRVRAGQKIAEVGATGVVTGAHLHFETIVDGVRVDPLALVAAGDAPRYAAPPAPRPLAVAAAPEPAAAPTATPAPAAAAAPSAPAVAPAPPPASQSRGAVIRRSVNGEDYLAGEIRKNVIEKLEAVEIRIPDNVVSINGDGGVFAFAGGADGAVAFADGVFEFALPDGEVLRFETGKQLSAEDRKRLDEARERMREEMRLVREQHRKSLERMKETLGAQEELRNKMFAYRFDNEDAHEIDEAEIERIRERALEQAARHREQADRARERALEQAERQRERALERAERERERAMRDSERDRQHALRDAERAVQRAATEEARLEALAAQEKALAEAERSIKQERARIEKMRKELERERSRKSSKDA